MFKISKNFVVLNFCSKIQKKNYNLKNCSLLFKKCSIFLKKIGFQKFKKYSRFQNLFTNSTTISKMFLYSKFVHKFKQNSWNFKNCPRFQKFICNFKILLVFSNIVLLKKMFTFSKYVHNFKNVTFSKNCLEFQKCRGCQFVQNFEKMFMFVKYCLDVHNFVHYFHFFFKFK